MIGVNEEKLSPEYLLNILLPNEESFEMITALVGELIGDDEILLGMNIVTRGDFAVTNVNQRTALSFRTPSVARINFVEDKKKAEKEEAAIAHRQRKDTKRTQKNAKEEGLGNLCYPKML